MEEPVILVTGATGTTGGELVRLLVEAGVPNVVFPTAIDPRGDGDANVFYGMADTRIGVARLHRTG
jgi:uncharacterized protein YbjT (DUF2867 family)